ncbi:MAG: geranylgeranyl reductase [Nitrospinae bacterium CG11_big_fil_rev_8_21_14_0_20_56_8]|nr:MAG: geranylgeranyl reductase [Nitrospinae bacterium CG11_big_fil_rev_8_21_14_0_20_56_8]
MTIYDAIVIGGGPAGAASALFLAERGHRVALLDQARFPRDKVCGEFISPAADPILQRLGILAQIESASPVRLRGVAVSSYETVGIAVDYPDHPGLASPVTSLSFPRRGFDHLLIQRARERGIEVMEGFKVTDFIFDNNLIAGVRGRDEANASFDFRSRMVIDAGGRNAIAVRRLGLKRPAAGGMKVAFAAHWEGAAFAEPYCYMHISPPGYTGTALVARGLANVVLVVDRPPAASGNGMDEFYRCAVLGNRLRREMLDGAQPAERVRTVESLAFTVDPPAVGGLVLVGDATGFIDPFTGEGIYLSLRSAELAAGVIDEALRSGDVSRSALARYDRLRRSEFRHKFILSKILQKLIYTPSLSNRVIGVLSRHPRLAELLVGVIGDYVPADRVVCWGFLGKLLAVALSGRRNESHSPVMREGIRFLARNG